MSCNGFYLFMLDVREREEKTGKKFPRGLEDVQKLASIEWDEMSVGEKEVYKEMAINGGQSDKTLWNLRRSRARHRQKTKQKQSSAQISQTDDLFNNDENVYFFGKEDEQSFIWRREKDVKELDNALSWSLGCETLLEKIVWEPFYVLGVQNYYETSDHDYLPAEIAVVKFTLMQGIVKQYHAILKPTEIPTDLKKLVENNAVCGISPEFPPTESRCDYRAIVDEIKHFYNFKNCPNHFRIFVLKDQFNSAQGAVKFLRQKTGSKYFIPYEKLSCVEDLFILLCNFQNQKADLSGFDDILKIETVYDRDQSTLCQFHYRTQSKFCALAIARKSCYFLFNRVKQMYNLNLTHNHMTRLSALSEKIYQEPETMSKLFSSDISYELQLNGENLSDNCSYSSQSVQTTNYANDLFCGDLPTAFQSLTFETEKIEEPAELRRPYRKSICSLLMEAKRRRLSQISKPL